MNRRLQARLWSAQILVRHGIARLREAGLLATARQTAGWAWRRLTGRGAPRLPEPDVRDEHRAPFERRRLRRSRTLDRRIELLQELRPAFDEIASVELLVRDRAGSSGASGEVTLDIALVDAAGVTLAGGRVAAADLRDDGFARIEFATPVRIAAGGPVYLRARVDADAPGAIRLWITRPGRDRLWALARGASEAAWGTGEPDAAPLDGSLVYRVISARGGDIPTYRWPPLPARVTDPVPAASRRLGWLGEASGSAPAGVARRFVGAPDEAQAAVLSGELDALVIEPLAWSPAMRELLATAAEHHVPVACRVDLALADDRAAQGARRRTLVAATFALAATPAEADIAARDRKTVIDAPADADAALLAERIVARYRRLHRPRVSIVTILYNKARELPAVLASYARQTYPGEIEVICVDDVSPDDSVAVVERFAAALASGAQTGHALDIRILRNERNSGNCFSRNAGIAAATGDIVVVIDADCMLNDAFVARHVDAHAFDECEIVVGPHNIETAGADPLATLLAYEASPALVNRAAELQDPGNPTSFLNCITRNVSFRRAWLPTPLFDTLFSYSADPASGFGWEDVEMGYRLYAAGGRIAFVDAAFSIHITPPPAPEGRKAMRSLMNFRRLFEKHPELAQVARPWAGETYARIDAWATGAGFDPGPERRLLEPFLGPPRAPAVVTRQRPLRVLSYRWHVPHQYELWKLPVEVTLVTGLGNPMTDRWDYGQRPLPDNARFRHVDEIDPRDYDLAILHFDENVLAPENTNGVIGQEWGAPFRYLHGLAGLPKVAICHGTPQFHGQYDIGYDRPDLMQPIEAERTRLVDFLADIHVVCNSHQAHAEWGFRRSSVIWHGFDPAEFAPATRERGILSPLGPLVMSRPHYRGYFLYRKVFDGHEAELAPETLQVPEPHPRHVGNAWARAKYQRYVDEIRRYTVYFNPTLRSPMPRARCEPMMCGVVTVNASNHDVDRFIENGVDGFHSNDPDELRDQLRFLLRDPAAAHRMGAAARRKALSLFHVERYLADWRALLADLGH